MQAEANPAGIEVELAWTGPDVPRRWVLPGPVAEDWALLSLRAAGDTLETDVERTADGGLVLELPQDTESPLHLRYRLSTLPPPDGQLAIDDSAMVGRGHAMLWLPEDDSTRPVSLEVRAPRSWKVATSFGLGHTTKTIASPNLLQHTDVLAGDLAWSQLETPEGRDDAALLGHPTYDFRWVAAETAGVRSSVDDFFLGSTLDPFTTLVIARDRPSHVPPIAVDLGPSSMLVDVDDAATWNAATRLPVACALVHRWLGGLVTIDMGPDSRPGEEVWFTQGVARHVARAILFELGTMSIDELLRELNANEALLATSALRSVDNAALVAEGSPEAVRLVVARGASYAARLDAAIRAHRGGDEGLRGLLAFVARRARHHGRRVTLSQWQEAITRHAGPKEAVAFREQVLAGKPIDIPADAFGPCFVRGKHRYGEFVLGLSETELVGPEPILEHVDPDGPAHRAGVRPGDRLLRLDVAWGDATTDVHATLLRGEEAVSAQWSPRGSSHVGRGWRRDPSVPDRACLLPPL